MSGIRVSGNRTTNSAGSANGPTIITSPGGNLYLNSTVTNVSNNLKVGKNIKVEDKLVVGNLSLSDTNILISQSQTQNVNNPFDYRYNPNDIYGSKDQRVIGALYVPGGVGIEKDLNVGGFIYGRISFATTSLQLIVTSTNVDSVFYPTFTDRLGIGTYLYSDNIGDAANLNSGLTYNPFYGKLTVDRVNVASSETSINSLTGALLVAGDQSVSNIYPNQDGVYHIGTDTRSWADAYLEKVYSKWVGSTSSNLVLGPGAGLTEIIGEIRVTGDRPIGTAPVITNTLYVTMDGDDTNDGRAIDPSRACRTIGGAMNSPYYQPGTQILVSPGRYLEDNPLEMKPYTSVRGSDIRTTFIEPINKTQDLFHMNSGCYLNYMTFVNGRSGRLHGNYDQRFNRGAYCTSFPPLTGDERIDLFQSPYIQNCTNQSGPWLIDGTMFIPNQTVQVPEAIAMGTWPANTASIIVSNQLGTLRIGQSINAGPQNPGFFNARTLLLANKPFIQSQTVAWVDATFNSGSFTYNKTKCERDTELIINAIAQDMLQDSTSDSTFSGIQYWNQASLTGQIPSEITATIAAITYAKGLAASTLTNAGFATQRDIVSSNFDKILDILNLGTSGITDQIVVNGLPNTNTDYLNAYSTLINSIGAITEQTITYIDSQQLVPPFTYNQNKCLRDTGLVVDAVAQDLLFEGTSQSTFSGIQYWNHGDFVGEIANELTTTTNAINFVKDLAQKVIINDTSGTRYSNRTQVIDSINFGTSAEVAAIGSDFDVITGILANGITGVTDIIVPNAITASTVTSVINSFNLLQANREYIKAEAIAFVEATKDPSFTYNQTTCARDVEYMINSVSIDLLYGGNRQAVQSGVYYYSYNANSTALPGEQRQTIQAYNYIKDLLYYIIQGIAVPSTYQSNVSQTIPAVVATIQEVVEAKRKIDVIINIIENGPSAVTAKTPIGTVESSNATTRHAAAIIEANRAFIQAEVIAFINATITAGYNKDTCRRDVGYILKSVAYDMLHGGNLQSIKSGVYYYSYSGTSALSNANEIPQTTAAYNFIRSIISNIVRSEVILGPYQTAVPQVTSAQFGTNREVETLQKNIDIITNIIRNGPTYAGAKTPINLVENISTGVLNAYNLLISNIPFIKAEVIKFLDQTMNNFQYSRQLCYRDAGIILENLAYDMAFGGNEKSIESGLAYYKGVTSVIAGQETQTIGAIDYIVELASQVVKNETCPVLVPPANIPVASQVFNLNLTGGEISIQSLKQLANITTKIILNGPDAAPTLYNSQGPDAAFVSAEVLLQANRTFIQENTINYINYNLCQPPKVLPYNQIKCKRDAGIIVDSIAADLLFPTPSNSQATFSGVQYFNRSGYTGAIKDQLGPTIGAVTYLRDLSVKIVQNITAAVDAVLGITRYTNGVQITAENYATETEVAKIKSEFGIILTILNGQTTGWTDQIVPNGGTISELPSVSNTVDLLLTNIDYLTNEVLAYVNANNPGFTYSTSTCARDVGYIIESLSFDLLYGGNRQAIQSGLSYYQNLNGSTVIPDETVATVDAFTFIGTLASKLVQGQSYIPLQKKVDPETNLPLSDALTANALVNIVSTITNIIANGPGVAATLVPITLVKETSEQVTSAFNILKANKEFISAETIAYLDNKYNSTSFNYDQSLCYRDTGLIIDAVSQDILLGGNQKSIESGLSYWNQGYNYVANQISTTTSAINFIRDCALKVIANQSVAAITGTVATQVINPFYQYGGDYMPQQAVARNFDIITRIITNGPSAAPPIYAGSGLFSITGLHPDDVKLATKVTSIDSLGSGMYRVGLNTPTVGFGTNATLYFGETAVFPIQDAQVESKSLEYTGNARSWEQRKIDTIGAMGGSLVDGAVISDRSPIQSFVYDAFTQLNQGGIGIHVTNNGYAQLVSVFTIFCAVGVQCDNGGIASITNSNCNFGDLSLVAKGYGRRDFSGTVFNPSYRAYPFSPDGPGLPYIDQFYPDGYWPNNGGRVEIFVPDTAYRPHIGLVMEVEPPAGHKNEQGFLGFLNVYPSTATLTTGTITLTGISTTDIYVGNTVHIRDQFGSFTGTNGMLYADTGTVVVDVNYNSITLNKALTSGGGDPTNPTYFTLYFCGNSYYTVQTSAIAQQPYVPNKNILNANADPFYEGPSTSQIAGHVASLEHMKSVVNNVIANIVVTPTAGNTATQITNANVVGGGSAQTFIDLRFNYITEIVSAANITAANAVVPQSQITTSGTVPQGAGSAATLISSNIDFIAEEVAAFVDSNVGFTYNEAKCSRDVGLLVDALAQDLLFNGTSQSEFSGIQYWNHDSRVGIIDQELTTTTNAINYIKSLAEKIVVGDTSGTRYSLGTQITAMPLATAAEAATIASDFDVITNILTNGVTGVTDTIIPNRLTADSDINVNNAYALLQANKNYLEQEAIAYVEATKTPGFTYNQTTCARDVGYIVDCISFDLLYGGNRQAIQSGVYYWGYNSSSSAIATEVAQSVGAYNYLRSIISDIITGTAIASPYQTNVPQVILGSYGTSAETTVVQGLIDKITGIIVSGPSSVTSKTPISLVKSNNSNIINAATIIEANRDFLRAEITAFVNFTYLTSVGNYNRNKCIRDVKLILRQIIYDLQSGGNYNSVYCGLSYWSRPGTYHIVELGEAVTRPDLFPDGSIVNFYQRSYISASGYLFEYVGAGSNYGALPQRGVADPVQSKETVQLNAGKVFFTSTDQNGDFRIGPGLVISQATGVLSGRTFVQSLYANMTPFILAIE